MKKLVLATSFYLLFLSCSNSGNSEYKISTANQPTFTNDTCVLIDNYLTKLTAEKNFSGSLLIIKDGKKLFSKGYGWANKEQKTAFSSRTLASIGSITKAFTAAAIMKLVEQNKLSLRDELKKFFPAVPSDKARITIHQLLTHSSGFQEFLKDDAGDYEIINTKDFINKAFSEPLAFKPGTKAVYTNVGYSVLGILIEQLSGMDYETYLREALFRPLGIKGIGYHYPLHAHDTIAVGYQNGKLWGTHQQHFEKAGGGPYWNLKANGGLEVAQDDMFLWLNSFTNNTILTDTNIQKMFTPHIVEDGMNGNYYFGYGCNITKSRRNTTLIDNGGSNGIYFARIIRLPEENVVFYMVTNESSINTNMVLPNVTQLYFQGKIEQDAITMKSKFEHEISKKIYDIVMKPATKDLATELTKEKIGIDDDMILYEVGQALIQNNKYKEALMLYDFYTTKFPKIVVAWNDKGDVHQMLNNNTEALKCYREALKIRPSNPRAKSAIDKLTKG